MTRIDNPATRMAAAMALAAALALAPGTALALIHLYGPSGMDYDVNDTSYGHMTDGHTDAYDSCYYLYVDGTRYYPSGTSGTMIWGDRGIEMGQHIIGNIRVRRTAWVPATGAYDYLRYYDTLENTGSSTASVIAEYRGDLGSDTSTIVTSSSSGDTTVDLTDTWYCTNDSSSITTPCGHVWTDGLLVGPSYMSLMSDDISTTFTFDIPPGETAALMIFAVQGTDRTAVQDTVDWLATLPDGALTGLTTEQRQRVVNWHTTGAPLISMVTETLEVDEGSSLGLEVAVTDLEGDSFDVYWELTDDGFFDDGTGLTATFDALGFDGDVTVQVGVKAVDSGGEERIRNWAVEVLNVPPVFISDPAEDPGLTLYRGMDWAYYIVVEDPANADGITRDPVIIDVVEKPAGMVYFGDNHLEWTPRIDGSDTGLHTLRIEADDRESEEPGVQQVTLEVLENAPPSAPTIVSPDGTTVWETRPTLVVQNATDIDGDPLSYHFEVAPTGDFATILGRGDTFEGTDGQTSWTVTTTLADGTRYYWRVWANDGRTDGETSTSWFDVDTSVIPPDASSDAPTDAPTDTWTPPSWGDDGGGCGCRTVPPAGAAPWAAVGLALIVLGLISRRRK